MRNIAIIPARSGSKGVKDKNIRIMAGQPLMTYSIDAAIASNAFDTIMVSTDSEKYADIGKKSGAEVPFLRSEEMSGDTAGSWDVVKEVISKYKEQGKIFDTICLLQPTSPLRRANDIVLAYKLLEEKGADAVSSVCLCEHQLQDMMQLDESLSLDEYRKNYVELPRQLCPVYYRLNGAIFIRSIEYSKNDIILRNSHEVAYIMDQRNSVDIDTIDDFEYAEFLLNRQDD